MATCSVCIYNISLLDFMHFFLEIASVRGPNTFSQGSVAYTIIYIFFKMCFLRSKDTERANYDKF